MVLNGSIITVKDLTLILSHVNNNNGYELSIDEEARVDIDGDGEVTFDDINIISNIILSSLPPPPPPPEGSIKGRLFNGYISGANGSLYDISNLGIPIETFTTDSYGRFYITSLMYKIPEVFIIEFIAGGIDIITQKVINTKLSTVSTKSKVIIDENEPVEPFEPEEPSDDENIINVNPLTTLVTEIIKLQVSLTLL